MSRAFSPQVDTPLFRTIAEISGAERHFEGLVRIPLRSPTLPPATTTNHYLVGSKASVLVDPATPHRASVATLLTVVAAWQREVAPVHGLFLTHHHHDHIAAATTIAERLGLPILAHPATAQLLRGRIDVTTHVHEGDRVAHDVAGPWVALHTPGHAPGHLVLQGPDGGMVAGDMVAGQGSILIDPRDGHVGDYIASLRRMRAAAPPWLAPAHGPLLHHADAVLEHYISHRIARETAIHEALTDDFQPADALLPHAYGDVSRKIWPLALRSLRAHLVDLQRQGRAESSKGAGWRRSLEPQPSK